MINSINKVTTDSKATSVEQNKVKITQEVKVISEAKKPLDPEVQLEIGKKQEPKSAYGPKGTVQPDMKTIKALMKEADDALTPLRQMVEELLSKQGMTFKKANFKATDGEMVEITPEIQAEAQKQIGENGAFNAENTSNRIVEFAKAISGGDKSKFDQIKESIQKGFDEATKVWGGELPEISKQTLDLAMQKLDDWKNEA